MHAEHMHLCRGTCARMQVQQTSEALVWLEARSTRTSDVIVLVWGEGAGGARCFNSTHPAYSRGTLLYQPHTSWNTGRNRLLQEALLCPRQYVYFIFMDGDAELVEARDYGFDACACLRAYVCVCFHACMHACIHTYIHVCVRLCRQIHTQTHAHTQARARTHTHTHTHEARNCRFNTGDPYLTFEGYLSRWLPAVGFPSFWSGVGDLNRMEVAGTREIV